MLRVVADTNVYVSALHFGGIPEEVLGLARADQVKLFVSPPILTEIERVLVRKFEWSPRRAHDVTNAIRGFAQLVQPQDTVHVISADEPDNRILECALEAGADVVVTGDRHLQQLRVFRGIAIMNPREFLEAPPRHSGMSRF